jgi:hypothetical protein
MRISQKCRERLFGGVKLVVEKCRQLLKLDWQWVKECNRDSTTAC